MCDHVCRLGSVSILRTVTKSVLPYRDTICVLAALEKQGWERQDGGNDVMDEVTHGGQGENGVIVTGEDEVERERGEGRASQGPPCSVG